MTVKINSLNSQVYHKATYIDCRYQDIHDLVDKSITIDFNLLFEGHEVGASFLASKTELSIQDSYKIKHICTPKQVQLCYYFIHGFIPPLYKIFIPI